MYTQTEKHFPHLLFSSSVAASERFENKRQKGEGGAAEVK